MTVPYPAIALLHPSDPTLARVVPGLTAWSVIVALVCGGMAVFFVVIASSLREPRHPGSAERPGDPAGGARRPRPTTRRPEPDDAAVGAGDGSAR